MKGTCFNSKVSPTERGFKRIDLKEETYVSR